MRKNRKRAETAPDVRLALCPAAVGLFRHDAGPADGTDTVLGGLAEGTDRVTGALADLTDNAMEARRWPQQMIPPRDAILDAYGSLVDAVGSWALTPDRSLQGERGPGRGRLHRHL